VRVFTPLCFSLLVLFSGGCATSYRVNIDSLAKPDANAISYALRNATSTEGDDSLRYQEAANLVRTALSGRGLYEAPPNVTPDVIVSIDYGVESLTRSEKFLKGPVKIGSHATVGPDGMITPPVFPKPEYETVTVTVYEKYLHLTARENVAGKGDEVAADVWRVNVTSEGQSRDVRKHLPILVAATIEYVGKDSRGEKSIRIKDTDADVVFVKKGM
jgi:hypothetical protein